MGRVGGETVSDRPPIDLSPEGIPRLREVCKAAEHPHAYLARLELARAFPALLDALESSESIRHAEKNILIKEIGALGETRGALRDMLSLVAELKENLRLLRQCENLTDSQNTFVTVKGCAFWDEPYLKREEKARAALGVKEETASPHQHIVGYDGAFHCLDCQAEWGALPGNPQMPDRCVKGRPRYRTIDDRGEPGERGIYRILERWGRKEELR